MAGPALKAPPGLRGAGPKTTLIHSQGIRRPFASPFVLRLLLLYHDSQEEYVSGVLDNLYRAVPKRSHAYVSCPVGEAPRMPPHTTSATGRRVLPPTSHGSPIHCSTDPPTQPQITEHHFGNGANAVAYCESLTSSLVTE